MEGENKFVNEINKSFNMGKMKNKIFANVKCVKGIQDE